MKCLCDIKDYIVARDKRFNINSTLSKRVVHSPANIKPSSNVVSKTVKKFSYGCFRLILIRKYNNEAFLKQREGWINVMQRLYLLDFVVAYIILRYNLLII